MAAAERAFARRAQDVSVTQAFIEFFADDAVGFESGAAASAQAELRKRPVTPRDAQRLFWWEPRYGDVAASGDLGWLTGPVRMGRTDAPPEKVRHGNYASVRKRQPDGRFKVVIDIGLDPPRTRMATTRACGCATAQAPGTWRWTSRRRNRRGRDRIGVL